MQTVKKTGFTEVTNLWHSEEPAPRKELPEKLQVLAVFCTKDSLWLAVGLANQGRSRLAATNPSGGREKPIRELELVILSTPRS